MLGATFILFILSLQTPMYETHEKTNNGNPRMQNAMGNETSAELMYGKNPNQLYPQLRFAKIPMPINSDLS